MEHLENGFFKYKNNYLVSLDMIKALTPMESFQGAYGTKCKRL